MTPDEKVKDYLKIATRIYPKTTIIEAIEIAKMIQLEENRSQKIDVTRKEAQEEYKRFILNILDGHDQVNKENGFAPDTNSIRLAIESRLID